MNVASFPALKRPLLKIAILLAALFTAAPARSADFILGVGSPGLEDARLLDDLGWGWARVPLRWSMADRGGDESWTAAERQIAAAKSAGMRVQLTLSLGWGQGANPSFTIDPLTGLPTDEAGRSQMQSFLQQAFSRFGSSIDAVGVEDDLSASAFPGGPAVYAQLLKYVSDSTRAVLPGKAVVFGAVDFNRMEEDQRVFYISDAIRALGASGVFDSIELRMSGTNPTSDYRRIVGAYNHLAGQVEGTPYENVNLLLLTNSPASGDREQASDLIRRAFLAAEQGFSGMYWDGLIDSGSRNSGLVSATGRRRSFASGFALGRMVGRFDLRKTQITPRSGSMFQLELAYRGGGTTTMVWRDYFAAGQNYDYSSNVELKAFDIEGPYRVGLMALPLVPDGSGVLRGYGIEGKTFDLGGAPVVLSKNFDMLRELGGVVSRPAPVEQAAPQAAPAPVQDEKSWWEYDTPPAERNTQLVPPR